MRSGESNEKMKSASLNNSFSSSNSAQAGIGSIFKNPLVCKTQSVNKPAQAETKPAKAKNQWTNFSLYGLDNEDEQDSNKRRNSSHALVIFFFVVKFKICKISIFATIKKFIIIFYGVW